MTKSRKKPASKKTKTSKTAAAPATPRKPRLAKILSARGADRHVLYEKSVQDPEFEVKLLEKLGRDYGHPVVALREDFCGTALLCARWVEGDERRTATGIDLDSEVLAWGQKHNLSPLGDAAARVRLLEQDVCAKVRKKHDATVALNFSYWVWKSREDMLRYFRSVRAGLTEGGFFLLDAYGGWEAQEPMLEPRKIKQGFTYVWDQDAFDPITNEMLTHIHFEFRDGTKMNRAFSYDWRFWSLPELRELLLEAGFAHVDVLWDDTSDEEDPDYRPRRHATNQPGWIAYLVATSKVPARKDAATRSLSRSRRLRAHEAR
jgi:SAM-dependent methyltransferase